MTSEFTAVTPKLLNAIDFHKHSWKAQRGTDFSLGPYDTLSVELGTRSIIYLWRE